ncbi:MAG: histidine kinase, partial [Sphingomonas sp.]
MIGTGVAVTVGAMLLMLILGGLALLYAGLRARADASKTVEANVQLQTILDGSPAIVTVIRSGGRIEMTRRMADWLGLDAPPGSIAELAAGGTGLSADDAARLIADITAAQRSGRAFVRSVRLQGSTRAITFRGGRAPGEMGAMGAVLLWAFDATDSEAEIARLGAETARLGQAYESLTGLIEAAPMPMWYRATDLRLAMVNTAYVDAVEGRDAADVVARGLELVEGSGRGGPLAGAAV